MMLRIQHIFSGGSHSTHNSTKIIHFYRWVNKATNVKILCRVTLITKPWDFFGRNDAKAETPVLWPPHVKS